MTLLAFCFFFILTLLKFLSCYKTDQAVLFYFVGFFWWGYGSVQPLADTEIIRAAFKNTDTWTSPQQGRIQRNGPEPWHRKF